MKSDHQTSNPAEIQTISVVAPFLAVSLLVALTVTIRRRRSKRSPRRSISLPALQACIKSELIDPDALANNLHRNLSLSDRKTEFEIPEIVITQH